MFATPRRWLEDGQAIKVEGAPSAFGPVSVSVQSHLNQGDVTADVLLPTRETPKQTLLRIRVPDGWQVKSATIGGQSLKVDERGTVDLTSQRGRVAIRFAVAKR
jgi:hypothetical protein